MSYLAAAIALIGLLAALNLLFTVGVVRRLRDQSAELAALRESGQAKPRPVDDVALPVGAPAGAFAATTIDGEPVTLGTFGERPLVGFFSPRCTPCKEQLPTFVKYAAARPGGRDTVLAVIVGTEEEAQETAELLRPVATVVVEPDAGPLQRALGVTGFPAFLLIEGETVAASDYVFLPVADRDLAVPAAG
ncbi:TlpA family protein disulfide reductase [Nonomuraea sp. NPDC050536]|uniref:TlpA family protein disulfide reductase n=1 Tax=Nonomuraea sp. NPDC050536 TaxID=3364366 RepID=UPI0037CC4618